MDEIKNTIICGKNEDVMPTIATGSIDCVITDPPYGWSFMGKGWDYEVPSVEQFREILRVLKPGGTMLCFAGSRTQHRMAVNVEDAGFILKDCIMWLYGSGFPKATDISKQIDKAAGAEREVVGEKIYGDGKPCHYVSEEAEAASEGKCQSGRTVHALETKPATPEALLWDGWKSHGLKPAYEPILVAMKCNDGSYANNALVHGVAGLNIDAGRIPTDDKLNGGATTGSVSASEGWDRPWRHDEKAVAKKIESSKAAVKKSEELGRFPANVILDEQAAAMLDEQSGPSSSSSSYRPPDAGGTGNSLTFKHEVGEDRGHNDKGGASRFFYCAKASKSERNEGCEGLAEREGAGSYEFRADGSLDGKQTQAKKNHHPTVKPLALMEYLCKLTSTPTGGLVLDPFAGSGTTLLAAYNTGCDYIGIERDPDYVKIIKARLANAKAKLGLFKS